MAGGTMKVRILLLASLYREAGGRKVVEVEASSWREALRKLRDEYPGLRSVVNESGEPEPGYIVFVDGVDYRLAGDRQAREIAILPVNHGGSRPELHFVGWEDIERAVDVISRRIERDAWKPNVIVGILRGGVVPARLLADRLGVEEIGVVEIKFYKGIGVTRDKPYIKHPLLSTVVNRDVLIVDDISDSGLTLQTAATHVSLYSPRSLRTAALYVKPWTKIVPDYYAFITDKWVVFPWEREETRREVEGGSK